MSLPRDISLDLLRDMVRIRRLEERAAELYGEGKIRGFLHLYIGEEAVAVGVLHALAVDDAVVATYREHGHALIKGVPMKSIMAEMYGRQEGCSRGRGGSMHLFDASTRFFGGNAIVAGGLPLAVGLALAERMQGGSRLCACFFGEGAMAEGHCGSCQYCFAAKTTFMRWVPPWSVRSRKLTCVRKRQPTKLMPGRSMV
jgi:pyruvate dehydrogenase E1 component alpha subunit